ncbi:response regulator [Tepidimonas taiwanensis]|uniref:Transcriptional regulatory protein DegU n=1 Tax=Tepidimonas taiwanensis TaxID=307486 RepID=A0A554X2J8_9BURK|nr:response regulator [Tepidimonas taiwanensis]TSE30070.1 Transcriptional regulatory protein DegU [Tepidimonas taiwanensis]UBQ06389.1 response regulator [Tepidimonas taiwanensis]
MKTIRLFLVDDHTLFRRGLRALLEQAGQLRVCGEAGDIGEALRALRDIEVDVILLDNHLPGVRGVDAIASLREVAGAVRIVMLTVSEDAEDLAAALRAGADGYLLKTAELDQLCDAVERAMEGDSVISPPMLNKLVSLMRQPAENGVPSVPASAGDMAEAAGHQHVTPIPAPAPPPPPPSALDGLSEREREILILIARGQSNKMIARALDIAETTVKIHVQHILRKLNVTSRVQAAVLAVNHGLG